MKSTPLRGVFAIEAAVAISLLALLAALLSTTAARYGHARALHILHQQAAWAAEAQLERYVAGAAIDSTPPATMLGPDVELRTQVEPGSGDWTGLDRVTVTATITPRHGRPIVERAVSYRRREGPS